MNQLIKKLAFLRKNSIYEQALEYYQQGNFERAVEGFQKVIANPQKADIYYNFSLFHLKESYLQLGYSHEHLGLYEEAVKDFSAAAKICNYADIHYHLGLGYCFLEDFEKAKASLSKAVEINPHYTCAVFLLGFAYVRLHQSGQAGHFFKKAVESSPLYADYHYFLGALYGLGHKFNLARQEFEEALRINPRYQQAKDKISLIEEQEKGKRPDLPDQGLIDEFVKDFAVVPVTNNINTFPDEMKPPRGENIIADIITFYEKAVELNPDYADLHYDLGVYYMKRGEFELASGSFLHALHLNPRYIQAMIHLALTYWKMEKLDQGIETFLRAVVLQPNYPDLYYHLGTLYAEKKDYVAAAGAFGQALGLNPDYPECHLALAILYEKQGDKKQALHYLHLYLENCSNPEWKNQIQEYIREKVD